MTGTGESVGGIPEVSGESGSEGSQYDRAIGRPTRYEIGSDAFLRRALMKVYPAPHSLHDPARAFTMDELEAYGRVFLEAMSR